MSPRRGKPTLIDSLPWRTDVAWPQDLEPLLHVVHAQDAPTYMERIRKLGVKAPGKDVAALETALAGDALINKLSTPQGGATSLAMALISQHPAGMDRDHLLFELSLLLDEDKRTADAAVSGVLDTGVVLLAGSKRGDRFRLLPSLRSKLAPLMASWLDALERKGAAAGSGDVLGMRIRTSPGHAMGLLLAYLGQNPPRLRTATMGTELHSRDQAKVLDAVHAVVERTTIPMLLSLMVRMGLAKPAGPRITLANEAAAILAKPPAELWRDALTVAVSPRAYAAVLRMAAEAEPGWVPESTLRRAIKTLHHTEQIVTGHPFPSDGRGNEAGARSEVEMLRSCPLLEPGRTPDGIPALRLHPALHGALRGKVRPDEDFRPDGHVGADHELHVGPSAPPHLLAALGFFAEPLRLDTVSRFRVTSASVTVGAARGVTHVQMEQVLDVLSSRGVPDNVKRTLVDYGSPRGRAMLGRGLVVAFADEADAQKARGDEEFSTLLGEELVPGVFLVDGAKEVRARARLVELGLAVGEDTLLYTAPPSRPDGMDDDDGPSSRTGMARTVNPGAALDDAAQRGLKTPPKAVAATVLHALTGRPEGISAAGVPVTAEVVPLRARKMAGTVLGVVPEGARVPAEALKRAQEEDVTVRLQYAPEQGGGTETMTVHVMEMFERAGTAMARVRFPRNPKAKDRVLRVQRVQWVEQAPPEGRDEAEPTR